MIPAHLTAEFTAAAGNHLWQSTVCAGVAGLLALALRRNHAGTRYWLWLAASVKFLIPFSLLTGLGTRLGWLAPARAAQQEWPVAMAQMGRPFTQAAAGAVAARGETAAHPDLWPAILLAVWAAGFLAVAYGWLVRWRRVRAVVRAGTPVDLAAGIPAVSSAAMLEPGVFGVMRPVLLLPEGITERLAPAHMEAIVAHELCHVRRRDNLAAAMHMAVEAIFWFHPLVWWVGARLVEERENACDEEVLGMGNRPEVYAESILKTCQFYLESPVACMSGIAGSDLKKRITRIMTQRLARKLTLGRKLLLGAAATVAVAGPVVFGVLNAPAGRAQTPAPSSAPAASFEVASVKVHKGGGGMVKIDIEPSGRFVAENVPLKMLLEEAYDVKDAQLAGAPAWMDKERYDIEAKPDEAAAKKAEKMTGEERKVWMMGMVRSLLAERFKLTIHHDSKEMQQYALVVAKGGPKMHEVTLTPGDETPKLPEPGGPPPKGGIWMLGRGELTVTGAELGGFANVLSRQIGRMVVDQTGLKGRYEFTLKWVPAEGEMEGPGAPGARPAAAGDAGGPSIFTALQEQVGLKLEPRKGAVDVIVIDHLERPSEN